MGSNSITLVNEKAELAADEQSFQGFLSKYNLSPKEAYYFVAIMGGQSGGKSTLLNALFGTSLAVLPQGERHATTKGIELALSTTSANRTLVLDLEGSDSSEKSESAGETFARKSSLFALAVSEVLIVNVWAHDIGKRSATNLPVLKSIFEAIFRIDRASHARTTLLFVLRDHNAPAHGPLPVLAEIISAGLADAWASLERPPRFAQAAFESLFAVAVHALPHKLFEPAAFDDAVAALRARFAPTAAEALVAADAAREKMRSVELGALYGYLRALWGCVSAMRELDIASQKESLTAQICEKAYEECCAEFSAKAAVFGGAYDDWGAFGSAAEALFSEALAAFGEKAFPDGGSEEAPNGDVGADESGEGGSVAAIKAIRTKWRLKLREFMAKELKTAQSGGKRFYERKALKEHKAALSCALADANDAVENVASIVCEERKRVFKTLNENLKKLDLSCCPITIYGGSETGSGDEFSAGLDENQREFVDKVQGVLLALILKNAEKALSSFELIYNAGGKGVWQTLGQNSKAVANSVIGQAESFAESAGKNAEWLETFQNGVLAQMENMADVAFARLALLSDQRLKGEFDALFKVDPNGLLRRWENVPDYESIWLSAKAECLDRLETYASKPKPLFAADSAASATPLADADALKRMRKSFENYALGALKEAEAQRRASHSQLPLWVYAVFLLLGFNEVVWVAKKPLLLLLLLALFGYAWVSGWSLAEMRSGLVGYAFQRAAGSGLALNDQKSPNNQNSQKGG